MADINAIAPGSEIQVKVVKDPRTAAARKTLVRLLSKDDSVKRENARLQRSRKQGLVWAQRGGREWGVRLVKQHPVKGVRGESGTITASLDVIQDLRSVASYVDVQPA